MVKEGIFGIFNIFNKISAISAACTVRMLTKPSSTPDQDVNSAAIPQTEWV